MPLPRFGFDSLSTLETYLREMKVTYWHEKVAYTETTMGSFGIALGELYLNNQKISHKDLPKMIVAQREIDAAKLKIKRKKV